MQRSEAQGSNSQLGAPVRFDVQLDIDTKVQVDVHYVLFTSNPLSSLMSDVKQSAGDEGSKAGPVQVGDVDKASDKKSSKVPLRSNESVLDLSDLSKWLPTAGINAEAAHRMREMFSFDEESEGA